MPPHDPTGSSSGPAADEANAHGIDLALLLDSMSEGVSLSDENGIIVYTNPAEDRMFGYEPRALVGQHVSVQNAYPDEENQHLVAEVIEQLKRTGRYEGEWRNRRKDGSAFTTASRITRVEIGGRAHFLCVQRDITAQHEMEERLRESEARYRALVENAASTLWVASPEGRIVEDSPSWRAFTGQTLEQWLGNHWVDAVHPEDRAGLVGQWQTAVATGEPLNSEFRLHHAPSRAWHRVRVRAVPLHDETGRVTSWVGMHVDVEETRRVENERRRGEARLRFIGELDEALRASPDATQAMAIAAEKLAKHLGVARCAYADVDADADRFIIRNDYSAPDVPSSAGVYSLDLFGQRAASELRCGRTLVVRDMAAELAPGEGREMFQSIGIDAIICCPLVKNDRLVAMMAVHSATARDWQADEISLVETVVERCWAHIERVGAEARLRESEAKFHAIANSIDQMVWSTQPDGYHDYFNDRWYEYTGVPYGSTEGEGWNDTFHPEDRERAWDVWRRCLETGEPYHIEYRLRHRSGDYRWVIGRAQPVRDEEGRITRWYGTCTDIDELVEARELLSRSREDLERRVAERTAELEATQETLRQVQKLESMGQLTGGVAHDFNNLLTPIVGSLDLLQRRKVGGEREQRLIEGAIQSADRAKTLVQRLLAFARRQPLQARAVDLHALVAGMADLVRRTIGPQVAVSVDVPAQLAPVLADANQLEMALLNLAVNARDAMPDGGTLRITAFEEEAGGGHRSRRPAGRYVCLSVADTGIGMDEATLARAVEPFFSTKGVGKGTGLGLSMVHGLASQLGGALTIQSAPGLGTNIELWLPTSEASADRPATGEAAPDSAAQARGTVLLVDDEELVRMSTADMLEDLGYRVVEAASAEEALRLVEGGLRPGVLVSDHLMPGKSGTELAHELLAQHPQLCVLIISGYAETDAISPDLPRLTKPFRKADLAASLSKCLERAE